jgi:hypothetical protein
MNDMRPAREGRLLRLAFTLTLAGLLSAVPIAVTWLFGGPVSTESPVGLAVLSAAAFAAASILFVAAGRTVGAMVALPAIAIGALLDDPATLALVLLFAAPAAEVAASVAAFGYPQRLLETWRRPFAEIRTATSRALASGPARLPATGPWVLDRLAVGTAVAATMTIAVWAVLVAASGAGDDPGTRTVLPAATEFPWVLGAGLGLAVTSAVACVVTGRVAGALVALPLVPTVWLDAPQRSEVAVVTLAAACGLVAVLASPIPSVVDAPDGGRRP